MSLSSFPTKWKTKEEKHIVTTWIDARSKNPKKQKVFSSLDKFKGQVWYYKFGILFLQLKPCFKIISDEIERLRLKFGQMLLA